MTPLGEYVKARRKELHLSAPQLAKLAGVDEHVIRNLENRVVTLPPPERIKALAAALQVTPADLLTAAGYIDEPAPEP